ncbi:hypothetical protein AGR7A_Cc120082 [Agrobacterium deltaense NCPPB 1641]|uniref:Uncharacterized protein n=1 Tax=Agrobacterium deltaense NCPPB 1641 TaxID=1183425 RepID=A0A1S7TIY6_9HYPH|nr:hypothetical protein AGR7A_Cc120082 [Agrobacterium deltaense NCPPB 1641]
MRHFPKSKALNTNVFLRQVVRHNVPLLCTSFLYELRVYGNTGTCREDRLTASKSSRPSNRYRRMQQ